MDDGTEEVKPGLAKRIADWLHEFFSDIRKAFEGVEARHEEARAMLDYMDELTNLWDDALVEAAENRTVVTAETENSIKNVKAKMSVREIGNTYDFLCRSDINAAAPARLAHPSGEVYKALVAGYWKGRSKQTGDCFAYSGQSPGAML